MRGADGGPWRRLCALPAFWVCLLTLAVVLYFNTASFTVYRVIDMGSIAMVTLPISGNFHVVSTTLNQLCI